MKQFLGLQNKARTRPLSSHLMQSKNVLRVVRNSTALLKKKPRIALHFFRCTNIGKNTFNPMSFTIHFVSSPPMHCLALLGAIMISLTRGTFLVQQRAEPLQFEIWRRRHHLSRSGVRPSTEVDFCYAPTREPSPTPTPTPLKIWFKCHF